MLAAAAAAAATTTCVAALPPLVPPLAAHHIAMQVRPLAGQHAQHRSGSKSAAGDATGYFAPLEQLEQPPHQQGKGPRAPQLAELLQAAVSSSTNSSELQLVLLQAAEQQLQVRHRQLQYLTHTCPVTLLQGPGQQMGQGRSRLWPALGQSSSSSSWSTSSSRQSSSYGSWRTRLW